MKIWANTVRTEAIYFLSQNQSMFPHWSPQEPNPWFGHEVSHKFEPTSSSNLLTYSPLCSHTNSISIHWITIPSNILSSLSAPPLNTVIHLYPTKWITALLSCLSEHFSFIPIIPRTISSTWEILNKCLVNLICPLASVHEVTNSDSSLEYSR